MPRELEKSVFDFSQSQELSIDSSSERLVERALMQTIRFSEVQDQMAWKRRERLVAIFGSVNFREVSTLSVSGLSQNDEYFDVLICSVDDVQRLKAAIRPPADVLIKNKLSIAYCERSSPARRTQLLKIGFDDVFYSAMSDTEINIRFQSLKERSKIYNDIANQKNRAEWHDFEKNHVATKLRGRQREIVEKLLLACGATVGYKELASYDYALNEYNMASLKVTVSNLRKKLKGYDIVSEHGWGYKLKARGQNSLNNITTVSSVS